MVKHIALAQSNAVAPFVPPLLPNFLRASFKLAYLQLYSYMPVLMSFQHRLIINTHHASAYDLILNVLDRYGSYASYVVLQSGSVYEVIIHSRSQSPRLIGLLRASVPNVYFSSSYRDWETTELAQSL